MAVREDSLRTLVLDEKNSLAPTNTTNTTVDEEEEEETVYVVELDGEQEEPQDPNVTYEYVVEYEEEEEDTTSHIAHYLQTPATSLSETPQRHKLDSNPASTVASTLFTSSVLDDPPKMALRNPSNYSLGSFLTEASSIDNSAAWGAGDASTIATEQDDNMDVAW
eukprot:CAMPEP_0172464188 /NCGR_PEP_ID=MMETSP1065-20121228/49675_1 /TAXON_ID=265537 /ORGANISM="Amphiprora paludosa, Strain CCMP125" /LENGTH=164 /DNA_ID=CAMNT_0013220357 /DNA_START=216 /DNA_END=707 /DNA_ORIENTATION=-